MKRKVRKILAACLVVLGVVLLWLAPAPLSTGGLGVALIVAGILTEIIGITLERRKG